MLMATAILGVCLDAGSGFATQGHIGATVASNMAPSAASVGDGARSRVRHQFAPLAIVASAYVTTVIASGTAPFPTRAGSPIDLFSLRVRI
jgi:hypothetical protein